MDKISDSHVNEKSLDERKQEIKDSIISLNEIEVYKLEALLKTFKTVVMTFRDCATSLGCHMDTIRRAVAEGKLHAFQQVEGGHWLVKTSDFLRYAETRKSKKKYVRRIKKG